MKRYDGKDTWAVVTGSSDGIGAEFARQLASKGFNIVLISRTKTKLEKVQELINKESPLVKTKIVVADFTGKNNLDFYRDIEQQCSQLDVSVVVANAGLMTVGDFTLMPGAVA